MSNNSEAQSVSRQDFLQASLALEGCVPHRFFDFNPYDGKEFAVKDETYIQLLRNSAKALNFVLATKDEPLTLDLIKTAYRVLVSGFVEGYSIRRKQVAPGDYQVMICQPKCVEPIFAKAVEYFVSFEFISAAPIVQQAAIQWLLVHIWPFEKFQGHLARLLCCRYSAIAVPRMRYREEYYTAIEDAEAVERFETCNLVQLLRGNQSVSVTLLEGGTK